MQPAEIARARDAARATVSALGLAADDAIVIHNSNKLALRLLPCDAFARVAFVGQEVARFEVELAQGLAQAAAPVAVLEPRVPPRVYERDGFAMTLWEYYEAPADANIAPVEYASALAQLHTSMRAVEVASPHFTDRVAEARAIVANRDGSPILTDSDRALVQDTLQDVSRAIGARSASEQLLHGEPHPGNVLNTSRGPRFIDLESCCRGPVEFDVAHVPAAVRECYPSLDEELLDECRLLVLAMVTAWRCEPGDQLPNGQRALRNLLDALRAGPPWPALDTIMP